MVFSGWEPSNGTVHNNMDVSLSESPMKHLNGSSSYSSSQDLNKNGEVYNGHSEKKHKHKDKHKDKDRHKHKSHKHDKDRDRDRNKDRDKEKSHKSSSSSINSSEKDKSKYDKVKSEKSPEKSKSDNSISSKDRDGSKESKHHKSKHKEKHRDKDREREKDRDRHRDKEKDKERKSSSSTSLSERNREAGEMKMEPVIKPEPPFTPVKAQSSFASAASAESDDDDIPLGQRSFLSTTTAASRNNESQVIKMEDSDDDDVPLALKFRAGRTFSAKNSLKSNDSSFATDESISKKSRKRSFVDSDSSSSSDELIDESDAEESDNELRKDGQNDINRTKSSEAPGKKRKPQSDSEDDDKPLISRKKVKTESTKVKKRARSESEESEDDYKKKKGKSKPKASDNNKRNSSSSTNTSSPRKKKNAEEEQEVWKWWEEAPRDDGVKWNYLEHKGPVFAPPYEPLPKNVQFRYNGKPMKLSLEAEEVAGFYSRFIEHEYTTKEKFNTNFFKDWRKVMTKQERDIITDLSKCDFRDINDYYKMKSEERKAMSKEEKQKLKEENEAIQKEYGICILDGHKEKIGNFKIEPPGLFRGRGDHPKMGMLKKRVMPEDVTINCSKDSKIPAPPEGRKWKEVRHDNTVTWLACWVENVQGQSKYVMLNPTSRLKGEKDWMKYEKARELAKHIDVIRENYKNDFKSKEMRVRQRAVALYFIDKLALRAGNEKDEDQADTVGCCSLRFEHVQLHDEKDGKENVVVFDFLGKDSIRYYNEVPVEKRVYKNLKIFMDNKKPGDDLFDRLNTLILNKHLSELMDGLTAKVFRTYNASHTLQQQLDEMTNKNGTVAEKILAYNRANRAVAILCNHQRAVPKSHEKSMENLMTKIKTKKDEIKKVKKELKDLHKGSKEHEKKSNALQRLQAQLEKLELNKTDKEEGKEIALGTSKLNYLDPRITVAWCKKHEVPIEKVYNKTQRAKFRWAIDMAEKTYRFD